MANNRMTEGVGKKIVEALKMQTDIEVTPNQIQEIEEDNFSMESPNLMEQSVESEVLNFDEEDIIEEVVTEEPVFTEPVFTETITPQLNIQPQQQFVSSELDDFEIPSNVAV